MTIDIVDRLRAEASYHYSSLFGDAADEILMLRKAIASRNQDAFDLGFKAAGGDIYRIEQRTKMARDLANWEI